LPGDRDLLLIGWCFPAPVVEAGAPPIRPLLPWLLSDRQNSSAVCEIVVHWCWEHVAHSCRLIDLLLKQCVSELTTVADLGEYKLLFKCFISVLHIHDSPASQTSRIDYGLSELFVLLKKVVVRNKVGDQKLLFTAIQHILKLTYQSKVATAWMVKHEAKYSSWFADYKRVHVEVTSTSSSTTNHGQYAR
jgi:hypothetical protein